VESGIFDLFNPYPATSMIIKYLTLLLLSTQAIIAQNFSITHGKEFSVTDKQFEVMYIGSMQITILS